ncbi:MAG: metalloregulator ArsR/SmtB family transcription factor [Nitrospira sp.]|nr:metalloregulator ArsR/SmtB family transcription factor [Nitrospira sp.]
MGSVGEAKAARLDAVLSALADATRRSILDALLRGEARVSEIAEPFDMSLNAVSKHIKVLEESGLVRRRIVGRDHYLSINARALDEIGAWIERMRRFWDERMEALERALEDEGGRR